MRSAGAPAGLLALLIIALAAIGLWYLRAADPESADSAPSSGPTPVLRWQVGTSQQYAVRVDSTFTLTMPGAAAGQTMKLSIAGELQYRTLEVAPQSILVGLRFTPITMAIDDAGNAEVNQALATPFRVRFSRDGRPLDFSFPAAVSAAHREVLENLVMMFQAVIRGEESWQAEERNGTGNYQAAYRRLAPQDVVKNKQRYLPAAADMAVPDVTSTEAITLDPGHDWIAAMEVEETLVTAEAGSPPTRVINHATLELLPAAAPVSPDTWQFAAAEADTDQDTGARARPAATPLSHEQATQQLLRDVGELNAASEGRSILIHRLRDLLLADDRLPEVLLESLRNQDLSDQTRADLYLAAELAGTPSAQAALVSVLYADDMSPQDAMRAIVALGGVSEPTGETLTALWDLARSDLAESERRDLPGTAALAIGSLGNNLRTADSVDYPALRAELEASVSSASSPAQRAVFLYALGNTADPEPALRRDIAGYLDDPSPRVRSAAARTLGRLGSDQVAEELLASAQQETASQVRASIVEALATWDQPSAPANNWVLQAIRQEQDERTRYNMAVFLGKNLDRFPQNRAVLQGLLATEQSRRIRQQIAEALY